MPADILFLVGPTGSGKSELAIRLAQRINGEIISCDSMLVYKKMNIGTAKPSAREQRGIKHHLISIIDPHKSFSVNDFRRKALKAIQKIIKRGKVPIAVGGSGLYVRSLLNGLAEQPLDAYKIRTQLSRELKQNGLGSLYQKLQTIDATRAGEILPGDKRRILRALEIFYLTGQKPTEWRQKRQSLSDLGYRWMMFGLNPHREQLYQKINERVLTMLKNGFLTEVKRLSKERLSKTASQAIGYSEFLQYLKGTISIESAIELTQKRTRHLAKKQWIWFRKENGLKWIALNNIHDFDKTEQAIIRQWKSTKEKR